MSKRTRIGALAALLALVGCASVETRLQQPVTLDVIEDHDPFRDSRTFTAQHWFVEGGPTSSVGLPDLSVTAVGYIHGDEHPEAPGASGTALVIISDAGNWRFLRSRDVDLILDGSERMHLGEASHDGDVYVITRVRVQERLVVPVTLEQLRRLGSASTVQMQVGGVQVALRPPSIEVFGVLAQRMAAELAGL